MGRRRIKLTVHGEGIPALRLAINVNPERYVTVQELLEVLSSEIHRHMGNLVSIPPGTKLFWKSSRGYTTPSTSYLLVEERTNKDPESDVASVLPLGLGLRHVGINQASRTRRANELSNLLPSPISMDVDKKGSDYFTDFILLKDASLVGDGDELLVDEWSDILKQTLDKQAEDARFMKLHEADVRNSVSEGKTQAFKPFSFDVSHLLDRDDAGVIVTTGESAHPKHASHLVLLQKVLRELMMYHIKSVIFLSAQCSKEASIAAHDLSMAQLQNERVSEALLDEVTLDGTITDPSAVLRALTQLAVQRGKEEREHSDGIEAEKMRQLASVYRARISRLEAALNVSEELADQLQKKAAAVDITFKEEVRRGDSVISRLETENAALRRRISALEESTAVLQEGLKGVAAVNERLFRENKTPDELIVGNVPTLHPRTPRKGLLPASLKTNITKLSALSTQDTPAQERGVLGKLQEATKSSNNAAQAVARRMEEDHFLTVLGATKDDSSVVNKVNKLTAQPKDSVRKQVAQGNVHGAPGSHKAMGWDTSDGAHRESSYVQHVKRTEVLLPSPTTHEHLPQKDGTSLTIQLHIVTDLGEKRIETIELFRGEVGGPLHPLDLGGILCGSAPSPLLLEEVQSWVVPIDGAQSSLKQAKRRRQPADTTPKIEDPTSSFVAFYQQAMGCVRRWQDSRHSIQAPSDMLRLPAVSPLAARTYSVTAALFALEGEDAVSTYPDPQVGCDHFGYLLFFRMYYVRDGRRRILASDEDLRKFLDPNEGSHFVCNVVEVSRARHEFYDALLRRGLSLGPLEDDSSRIVDAKESSELGQLLQFGGHNIMGPAFSLVDDPVRDETQSPSAASAGPKRQQFFVSKRTGDATALSDQNVLGTSNVSPQDAKSEEVNVAVASPNDGTAGFFLGLAYDDLTNETNMRRAYDGLVSEFALGPVPGLPVPQQGKMSQKYLEVDEGGDSSSKRVTVAHVIRYLCRRFDDMGDEKRFWRLVEQTVQSHGMRDDSAEISAGQSADDNSGVVNVKNIDDAISAAIQQAKGAKARVNPRASVSKEYQQEIGLNVPGQTRAHHFKKPVLSTSPISFATFVLICLRLAKE